LEVLVGALLRGRNATLAVAESCTGGLLGARLTSIPGSSRYFSGGFITYSNALKREMLGVPAQTLERFGAVSPETAEAMAAGTRERTGSTYAISITGIAGPDGGSEEKPVGLVYLGIAGPEGTAVAQRRFIGDRERIRVFTTQAALDLLRRRLQGLEKDLQPPMNADGNKN
jgi:nicotinamide-nucleotide amidase